MKWLISAFIRAYQLCLSPILRWVATGHPHGPLCRFQPTCSHYGLEAVRQHGALRGSWLTLRRILRCHPWGGCGPDPVPPVRPPRVAPSERRS